MNIRRLSIWTAAIIFAAGACSSSDSALTDTQAPTSATTPASQALSAEMRSAVEEALTLSPVGCDELDTSQCLLPFPSNRYAVADESTPTGLRVNIPASSMPANASGVAIDATDWNTND